MSKIAFDLFILGLSFGSGACIASCGPLLISYVAGTNKGALKGLLTYTVFSLARISVYVALSLVIFFLGRIVLVRLLGGLSRHVFILGGMLMAMLGIMMIFGKKFDFKPWHFLQRSILEHDSKSIVILGLVIGLLPCGPLLILLSYIGLVSKSWLQSLFYGLAFGLGTFLSPLILIIPFAAMIPRLFLNKKEVYYKIFSLLCALIIIYLGIGLIIKGF